MMGVVVPSADEIHHFDCDAFIAKHGGGTISKYQEGQTIYVAGDTASALYYLVSGTAEIVVNSKFGKEAVIGILGAGDFFGESCLDGNLLQTSTIVATSHCVVARFDKAVVTRALREDADFSKLLLNFILDRNAKLTADLVDHLFNSSEKRLARILLSLANMEDQATSNFVPIPMNQELLAKMVGTTRSRINGFMNKFRKMGYIQYNGKIQVNGSLMSVLLTESRTSKKR